MRATALELFCGYGNFSKICREYGISVVSIDIRSRKNVCEPDIQADIMNLRACDIPIMFPTLLWVGLPCDVWSYASGNKHWKENVPISEKCADHLKLLDHVLRLIDDVQPLYFFIENPRGRLRNWRPFLEWLERKNGVAHELTLSSYGFETVKPTNIFTNCPGLKFREKDPFGRGAKGSLIFSNKTKAQRQKTPRELYVELFKQLSDKKVINKK